MGGVGRLAAQHPIDHSRYLFVTVSAWPPGPQFIVQTAYPLLDEAPAPFAHSGHAPAQALGWSYPASVDGEGLR
jgi:hypothetical protein